VSPCEDEIAIARSRETDRHRETVLMPCAFSFGSTVLTFSHVSVPEPPGSSTPARRALPNMSLTHRLGVNVARSLATGDGDPRRAVLVPQDQGLIESRLELRCTASRCPQSCEDQDCLSVLRGVFVSGQPYLDEGDREYRITTQIRSVMMRMISLMGPKINAAARTNALRRRSNTA